MHKPQDWNDKLDGGCQDLVVRASIQGGNMIYESAWELTPNELKMLQDGGVLILKVVGGQPPVWLYTSPPHAETSDGET